MRLKVRLLAAGFLVSFLLVVLLALLSFYRIGKLADRVGWVEHTYVVVNTSNKLSNEFSALDKAAFRFLITHDSTYIDSFEQNVNNLYLTINRLRQLCADNPRQQEKIIGLQSDALLYIDDSRNFFSQPAMPLLTLLQSDRLAENRKKMWHGVQQLAEISAVEGRLLQERKQDRESYLKLTTSLMRLLSVIFGLLTLLLFGLLYREFRKRLKYQAELQVRISEIDHSKRELEHIAYATSHDLQEPLRKIRILTDRWHAKYKDVLGPDSSDILERVVQSAARMQDLVAELMMLASLNADSTKQPCSILRYINAASDQLREAITAKDATLSVEEMPDVEGYPEQLKLLFKNLIDNALKFSRPGVPVQIAITARAAGPEELPIQQGDRKYHCIIVEDNGIGFENQHAEKMFGIFRRLHTMLDSNSKGTGLAICRRIMSNHNGFIIAHSFPGSGATFKLYFPLA